MKRLANHLKSGTLILSIMLLPISIQAATLQDVINSVNAVYVLIAKTVNATVTSVANLLYESNPNLPATIATNLPQQQAKQKATLQSQEIALAQIKQSLVADTTPPAITLQGILNGKNTTNTSISLNQPTTISLANQPASDYFDKPSLTIGKLFPGFQKKTTNLDAGNANFNFNSLLAPTTYSPTGISNAFNFIQYAARMDEPLMQQPMTWSELTDQQKKELQETEAGQAFKVALRSMIANRSVGVDNLYRLMAERIPQTGLGKEIGSNEAISPFAIQKNMATRRTNSIQWYRDMASASPTTVAREQLFVLAEMERLLFQLHQDNEHILATLSMMQIQNTNQQKLFMQKIESEAASSIGISISGAPTAEELTKQLGIEAPPAPTTEQQTQ